MFHAGKRFGDRLGIRHQMDRIASGPLGADSLPIVGGAVAVATLGKNSIQSCTLLIISSGKDN